ncbi:helix-turn-helix domain-containing protein [Gammaproteobacteria bacterium]|nr:helix-turn-helix domain-containing protein [Gammaproteobacteria bacterium]
MTELAQRIQAARKAKGMTQDELAQAAGTGQAHLSRIENGDKNPSAGMLTALAKALDTTVSQLVGDRPAGDTAYPKGSAAAKILADRRASKGLKDLARDINLVETLYVSQDEWRVLRSIDLPKDATKDGYVQLLYTVRAITVKR